jgi:hypothetical protein
VVPALIERARQEVALARVVGKFTVDRGIAELRRRLDGNPPPRTDASVESLVELGEPAGGLVVEPIEQVNTVSGIRAAQLVLPDYDHLPAAHVVAKLASLTQAERDAVEEYETANRHRRTILGKLDQLRSGR